MSESFPTKQEETLFSPYRPGASYGFFGYNGACVDLAIRHDRVDLLLEAIERGWITPDCVTIDGCHMVKHARRCGADAVVAQLLKMGFADEPWAHGITIGPKREQVQPEAKAA